MQNISSWLALSLLVFQCQMALGQTRPNPPATAGAPTSFPQLQLFESRQPLQAEIANWVKTRPQAKLADVVQFANQSIAKYGVGWPFLQRSWETAVTAVGEGALHGLGLPRDNTCHQRWIFLPLIKWTPTTFTLVGKDKIKTFYFGKDLYLTKWRTLDAQNRTLAEIPAFTDSFPLGFSADGQEIYMAMGLSNEALPWWKNIAKTLPADKPTNPFLVLKVTTKGFEISANPTLYAQQKFNMIHAPQATPTSIVRLETPNKMALELIDSCLARPQQNNAPRAKK